MDTVDIGSLDQSLGTNVGDNLRLDVAKDSPVLNQVDDCTSQLKQPIKSMFSNPWDGLKIRVISRAFYEDAYLDFFIKYYAALGFDTITILKADTDKFTYTPPVLDPALFKQPYMPKIEVIPVQNDGNEIIVKNYKYYADSEYNWILNIDADEFLMFDLAIYPHGIKEFIYKVTNRIVSEGKVHNADNIQQIKFRWLCINKMNARWPEQLDISKIADTKLFMEPELQQHDLDKISPRSFMGYIITHKLELYKYIKSISNTKWANTQGKINAHFFYPTPINGRNYNLLDGEFNGINNSNPRYFPRNGSMGKDGFIVHLNTRSLANAVTKCLVTKLRDNKKIKDPDAFRKLINTYQHTADSLTNATAIKGEFAAQLNSKTFFPAKIRQFHKIMGHHIRAEYIKTPISALLKQPVSNAADTSTVNQHNSQQIMSQLVQSENIGNQDLEWQILHDLCIENQINPVNMKLIIELF